VFHLDYQEELWKDSTNKPQRKKGSNVTDLGKLTSATATSSTSSSSSTISSSTDTSTTSSKKTKKQKKKKKDKKKTTTNSNTTVTGSSSTSNSSPREEEEEVSDEVSDEDDDDDNDSPGDNAKSKISVISGSLPAPNVTVSANQDSQDHAGTTRRKRGATVKKNTHTRYVCIYMLCINAVSN
jgi:hypothetical protein